MSPSICINVFDWANLKVCCSPVSGNVNFGPLLSTGTGDTVDADESILLTKKKL